LQGDAVGNHIALHGGLDMRRFVSIFSVLFFLSLSLGVASWAGDIRHKDFSDEEIRQMAGTRAVIETKFGTIVLEFFPETAANHVDNFITLAKDKFYDGTLFHRVIPGFMIQGGDPNSRSEDRDKIGRGGPGYSLKAEFSDRHHKRGTLSMARSRDPDSAGSQFFICIADAPHLDGQYTVFGEVVSGMEVVDKIASQPRDRMNNPLERVEMTVKIGPEGINRAKAERPLRKEEKKTQP
jgi:peptidyl-prolyl cis-trans isomerase B (cyclophilin B)